VRKLLAGRVDVMVGDWIQRLDPARSLGAAGQILVLPKLLAQVPRYVDFALGDAEWGCAPMSD
jgi:polar amino acid transport system substrate-binding protein